MADLPLTGGCLCGAVRFEVTEPLVSAGYCHCTRCQRRTGTAASAQARIVPGSLRILSGNELIRAYEPPDGFAKHFCSACGSALWSRSRRRGRGRVPGRRAERGAAERSADERSRHDGGEHPLACDRHRSPPSLDCTSSVTEAAETELDAICEQG